MLNIGRQDMHEDVVVRLPVVPHQPPHLDLDEPVLAARGTARSHFWRRSVGYGTANSAPEYLAGLAARISSRTSRTVCASVWGPMPGWKIFSDRWLTAWGCLASAPFSPSAKSATKAVRKLGGVATPRT